jgi:spore photoproduct lyase
MQRRCFNFLKILPYTGTCPYNCAYCWFRDPVLVPRVNVRFFDHLPEQLADLREQGRVPTVFTFTHYKSDCFAIDHLTGYARLVADFFENEPGFVVQFLSKAHHVDSLLDPAPHRGTIVTFSVNAPWISRGIDLGTSSIEERLDAGRRLHQAGIPVMLRIDPMLVFDGWRDGYDELAAAICVTVRMSGTRLSKAAAGSSHPTRRPPGW